MARTERIYDRHISEEMVETLVISPNGDVTIVVGPLDDSWTREDAISRAEAAALLCEWRHEPDRFHAWPKQSV